MFIEGIVGWNPGEWCIVKEHNSSRGRDGERVGRMSDNVLQSEGGQQGRRSVEMETNSRCGNM